jgi:hypothetical protein
MGLMAPDRPLVVEDEAAGLSVHVTVFEKGHKRASHVRVFERDKGQSRAGSDFRPCDIQKRPFIRYLLPFSL